MRCVDLNADVGEGFGAYSFGQDEAILDSVTSANIACGFHAGDPGTMRRTVTLAVEKGVAIGAHPGLPDLVGFGRRELALSPAEAYDLVVYQVGALRAFVIAGGASLRHVKPHGALYNRAARDRAVALAIGEGVRRWNRRAVLVGLAGSGMLDVWQEQGSAVAAEAFADRRYEPDGSLRARSFPNALITDPAEAVAQVLLVSGGRVRAWDGSEVAVSAGTICIHSDTPEALAIARAVDGVLRHA